VSWTEVKHALNSSLGTNNFKPLDIFIKDIFENNYVIIPSDTEFLGEAGIEYVARYDGEISLNYQTSVGVGEARAYKATLTINDVIQGSWTATSGTPIQKVKIKKGDKIVFDVIAQNSDTNISYKFIGGKVQFGKSGLYEV
jgi:hypothetical protein